MKTSIYNLLLLVFEKIGFIRTDDMMVGNKSYKGNKEQIYSMFFLVLSWVILIAAIAWTFVSYKRDFDQNTHNLFAPSGAVLVLTALWTEYISSVTSIYTKANFWFHIMPRFECFHKGFRIIGMFLATLGTLIWAYGDRMF